MNITGEVTVEAPRDAVFNALRDARFFASCIEGVSDLKQLGATRYEAMLAMKVAYMQFRFRVTVELTRIEPPSEIEAKIEGVPLGIVGRLTATSVTRLEEIEGDTTVGYTINAALTGKLGGLGQPVLKAKAREMEKQFGSRLRAAFERTAPEAVR